MRKFSILSMLVLAFVLAACGPAAKNATSDVNSKAQISKNFNGDWTADHFEATIVNHVITVNFVDKEQETTSLFWKGTFLPAHGPKIISKGDVDALASSMMGSQEIKKPFIYDDDKGTLSFIFSIAGTSKNIHLERS